MRHERLDSYLVAFLQLLISLQCLQGRYQLHTRYYLCSTLASFPNYQDPRTPRRQQLYRSTTAPSQRTSESATYKLTFNHLEMNEANASEPDPETFTPTWRPCTLYSSVCSSEGLPRSEAIFVRPRLFGRREDVPHRTRGGVARRGGRRCGRRPAADCLAFGLGVVTQDAHRRLSVLRGEPLATICDLHT